MMGAMTPETCRVTLQSINRLLIVASRWTVIDLKKKGKSICLLLGKNITALVQKQNFSLENIWGMGSTAHGTTM